MNNKYWSKIIDGVVVETKVCTEKYINTFIDSSPGEWVETFIEEDHPTKNFGQVGYLYNKELNIFTPPRPIEFGVVFNSWTINNETGHWEAPIDCPVEGNTQFKWNEETQSWDAVTEE